MARTDGINVDLDQTLRLARSAVLGAAVFDRCGIFLYDSASGMVRGTWGTDPEGHEECISHIVFRVLAGSAGPVSRVIAGELAYALTSDYARDVGSPPGHPMHGVHAHLVVPLRAGPEILGAIAVDNLLTDRPIAERDVEYLLALAALTAGSVLSARHHAGRRAQPTDAGDTGSPSSQRSAAIEAVIEQGPAVAFIWRNPPDWRVDFVSGNVRQFGYVPEDFGPEGLSYGDIMHPDDRDPSARTARQYYDEEHCCWVTEYRLLTKGGSERWVEDRSTVETDPETGEAYQHGIVIDISLRKEAEGELRRSLELAERSRRAMLSALEDYRRSEVALASTNRELETLHGIASDLANMRSGPDAYEYVVRKLREITGGVAATLGFYDSAEQHIRVSHAVVDESLVADLGRVMDGRSLVGSVFPVSDEKLAELLAQPSRYRTSLSDATFGVVPEPAAQAAQRLHGIDRFLGVSYTLGGELNGASLVALRAGAPDPSAALVGSFAGLVSVTLRRLRSDDAVRESEERFRGVFENASVGKSLTAPDGALLNVNQALADMLGHGIDELQVMSFAEITHPADLAESWECIRLLLAGERTSYRMVKRYRHRSGRLVCADVSTTLVRDAHECPRHFITTIIDITEQRRVEEAFREKHAELERFTYVLSHDLRSPLVTVKSFLGFLIEDLRSGDADKVEADLGYIGAAADKMLGLLDEIRDLSRIGRASSPSAEAPLHDLAHEALDLVAGRVAQGRIAVAVADEPIMVTGDRARMVSLFANLLDNAAKFMGDQPDPRVEIGVEDSDGAIVIFVRDNGLGFDPAQQHRLFGAFERLHPGIEGTGLGLAIVKRTVEVHGGRIWAESDGPGKGATFRFTLPGTRRA